MIASEKDHPDVNIIPCLLINSDHGYDDDDDDDDDRMMMMTGWWWQDDDDDDDDDVNDLNDNWMMCCSRQGCKDRPTHDQ